MSSLGERKLTGQHKSVFIDINQLKIEDENAAIIS
jgi:hypothetical protein